MDFIFDPSLVLYLPLHKLDGASIKSEDAYGHLCAVTGALWTPQGRTFDGIDDKITTSKAISIPVTGIAWVYPTLSAEHKPIISTLRSLSNNLTHGWALDYWSYNRACVYLGTATGYGVAYATSGIVKPNHWYCFAFTFDGYYLNTWVNTIAQHIGQAHSGYEDWVIAPPIGTYSFGTHWYQGSIGELLIYNRVLTPLEIQHIYLATKWRYI